MKYYDLNDKKYHNSQDVDNNRIPFPNGLIQDAFDRVSNGESVNVEDLNLNDFFDKDYITKQLLYIELKRLVKLGVNKARQEEIIAILNPPQKEVDEPKEEN